MDIQVTERQFTISLSETEVSRLVERLKFKQQSYPDLTEPLWKALETRLGYKVTEIDI